MTPTTAQKNEIENINIRLSDIIKVYSRSSNRITAQFAFIINQYRSVLSWNMRYNSTTLIKQVWPISEKLVERAITMCSLGYNLN